MRDVDARKGEEEGAKAAVEERGKIDLETVFQDDEDVITLEVGVETLR